MGGFAGSKVLEVHGKRIMDGNFEPGFKLKLHRKDLNIALQTARALKAPIPATALVASQMDACMGQGKAEKDHVILAELLNQAGSRAESAAIHADVFANHKYARVGFHRLPQGFSYSFHISYFTHRRHPQSCSIPVLGLLLQIPLLY
jgi:hypothetical protein